MEHHSREHGVIAELTRPDLPPGPGRELTDALHDLHHTAGWPSLRKIARDVGVSPTTVSAVFSSPRVPSWGLLELVVEALGGDVEEFRTLWLRASTRVGEHLPDTALIAGRRAELTRVRDHLSAGAGLLLVTGEAGIGKTRLVDTARHTTDVVVARGCGLPLSAAVPLLPVATALRTVFDVDRGQWLKEALVDTAPYVRATVTALLPELGALDCPAGDRDMVHRQMLAAVATTLSSLAQVRPLGLLLEDLHWADLATLELVEHLVSVEIALPIVATFRVDDPTVPGPASDWFTRVRRLPAVGVCELGPLSRKETEDQLQLLKHRQAGELADAIYRRSGGLPLFTEQLAGQAATEEPLPSLLTDLLDERIRGLRDDEFAVVVSLAVADRPLPPTVLAQASRLPDSRLADALRHLDGRRLLAAASPDVALRHPLLAEAVRRRLVGDEPPAAHRALAEAFAGISEADPAEVAAHWRGAGEPEREVPWRLRAAQVALARGASLEAADQWVRACEVWPAADDVVLDGTPVPRVDVQLAAIDLLEDVGRKTQAFGLLDDLRERADSLPRHARAVVDCRVALSRATFEDMPTGLASADAAIAELADAEPSGTLIDLLDRYAFVLSYAGREPEIFAARERALACARELGDTVRERTILTKLVHRSMARHDVAAARAQIAEGWAVRTPRPHPLGDVRLGIAATDLVLKTDGTPDEMEEAGRRALAVIEAWGLDSGASNAVRANMSRGFRLHGRLQRCADLIDVVDLPSRADDAFLEEWPLHLERVALDTIRGRLDEAAARGRLLDELHLPIHAVEPEFHDVLADVDLWAGRPDAARARLDAFITAVSVSELSAYAGGCLVRAVRATADVAATSPAGGDDLVHELREWRAALRIDPFRAGPIPGDGLEWEATWTAELSRLVDDARPDLWVAAATGWDARTRPFEASYCRWRGAQAALRTGHGTLAQQLLHRAARDAREHVPLSRAVRLTAGAPAPSRTPTTSPAPIRLP